MAEEEEAERLDLIRIEKADGCVWEYWVKDLRLEYIGAPPESVPEGQALGSVELEGEVFRMQQCGPEDAEGEDSEAEPESEGEPEPELESESGPVDIAD